MSDAYCAVLLLSKEEMNGFRITVIMRVSYVSEEDALGACLLDGRNEFPGFDIGESMAITIPFLVENPTLSKD